MEKNSLFKPILKLFGSYCSACFLTLILGVVVSLTINNALTRAITQIACCAIAFTFMYITAWQMGSKDKNKVNYNHKMYDSKLGFKYGLGLVLILEIPYILLFISKLTGRIENLASLLSRLAGAPFLTLLNSLLPTSQTPAETPMLNIFLSSLLLWPLAVIVGCAYIFGYHGYSVFNRLAYKKPDSST